MPRDSQGRWMPEPHRAGDYDSGQVRAASDLLSAFRRGAADAPSPQADAKKAQPVAAATTIQRMLTPFGDVRLAQNAQDRARMVAAQRMARSIEAETPRDVQRNWKARQMLEEFEKANQRAHARDNGLER